MCIHIEKLTVVAGLHNRQACCTSRGCALCYVVVVTRYSYNYQTSILHYGVRCTNLPGHDGDDDDNNNIILSFRRYMPIRRIWWPLISQRTTAFMSADRELDRSY